LTDRKERREASRPGGGKPGHEGHSQILSEAFDRAIDHRPDTCTGCCAALPADLAAERSASTMRRLVVDEARPPTDDLCFANESALP